MKDRPRFVLTLEVLPAEGMGGVNVPAEVRLRRLLKAMLRSYGLRCIKVAPLRAADDESDQATEATR